MAALVASMMLRVPSAPKAGFSPIASKAVTTARTGAEVNMVLSWPGTSGSAEATSTFSAANGARSAPSGRTAMTRLLAAASALTVSRPSGLSAPNTTTAPARAGNSSAITDTRGAATGGGGSVELPGRGNGQAKRKTETEGVSAEHVVTF